MEEESKISAANPETHEPVFTYDDIATPERLRRVEKDLKKRSIRKYCNLVHKLAQYNIPAGRVYSQFKDKLKQWCDPPDNPNWVPGWTAEQLDNNLAIYVLLYFCQDTDEPAGPLDD